jgi:hypothetical protein
VAAARVIPRWARRGSRLDRWYARSYWNRVAFVSTVSGAIVGAATALDRESAPTGAAVAALVVAFTFVWAFASILWRRVFLRFGPRGGRST